MSFEKYGHASDDITNYLERYSSIDFAAFRPEAIALTIRLAPLVASPATKTLAAEVSCVSSE
jgi:hypothetical protein